MKELIKSTKMGELLRTLKQNFDIIIIDSPGVINEDYTLNLAACSDFCLFIVGSGVVEKHFIDESLQVLDDSGIRPLGIVLNRVLPFYIDDERTKLKLGIKRSRFVYDFLFRKR